MITPSIITVDPEKALNTGIQVYTIVKPVATSLIQKATDKIRTYLETYNETHMEQMNWIRRYYDAHCYPLESQIKSFKTTLTAHIGELEKPKEEGRYPVFFQFNESNNMALLKEKNFYPEHNLDYWIRGLGSQLKHPIEEIISYICEYQAQRDCYINEYYYDSPNVKTLTGGDVYHCDPTTMFFEELKSFFVYASFSRLNETLLKAMEAREQYLKALYLHHWNKDSKKLPLFDDAWLYPPKYIGSNPHAVIGKTMDYIRNNIIETIKLEISRQSARDICDILRLETKDTIKNCVKFLFYVIKDPEFLPNNFIFNEIRKPTIKRYIQNSETLSGQLLSKLINTEIFKIIFPQIDHIKNCEFIESDLLFNVFETKNVKLLASPPPEKTTSKTQPPSSGISATFFNTKQQEKQPPSSGILATLLSNKKQETILSKFLELHSLCYQLSQYYLICDTLYELAGDGGNLLIYGKAAELVKTANGAALKLLAQFTGNMSYLYNVSNDHYRELMEAPSSNMQDAKDIAWKPQFSTISFTHDTLKKSVTNMELLITGINNSIAQFNIKENVVKITKKLEFLDAMVNSFMPLKTEETYMLQKIDSHQSETVKFIEEEIKSIDLLINETKIHDALVRLSKLEEKYPKNPEILFNFALQHYKFADAAKKKNQETELAKHIKETHRYLDATVRVEKENFCMMTPLAYLQKAKLFLMMNDNILAQSALATGRKYLTTHQIENKGTDAQYDELEIAIVNREILALIEVPNKDFNETRVKEAKDKILLCANYLEKTPKNPKNASLLNSVHSSCDNLLIKCNTIAELHAARDNKKKQFK